MKIRLIIYAFLVAYFSACSDSYSVQSDRRETSIVSGPKINLDSPIKIPRVQSGFDVGYGLVLQPSGDILAAGWWNTRGNYLYRWLLKDRQWNQVQLPTAGINVNARIYFGNPNDGWLVSDRNILGSHDGGQTWLSVPLNRTSEITRLQAVSFVDSKLGFIGGTTGYMNRNTFEPEQGVEILCTEDGGRDFRVCYKSKEYDTVREILSLNNEKTTLALVDGTALLITTNGGKDWTEKALPATANGIAIENGKVLWIVGSNGTFLYSQDLGDSWKELKLDLSKTGAENWNAIAFGENRIGIAVGDGGLFAVSVNGQDWEILKSNKIDEDLYDIQIRGSHLVVQGKDNIYSIVIQDAG